MTEKRKEDRRSIYTRRVIKEAFFEALEEKGRLESVSITDICKRADINRSTFYLHYDDKFALLRHLIIEELSADPVTLALKDIPICQRLPTSPAMQKLFHDPALSPLIAECIIDVRYDEVVPELMNGCGLTEDEARSLFIFMVNGSLAVSRALDWKYDATWENAQRVITRFVEGGTKALE